MPNIAVFHPQIVHFVIALFFVGLAFRLVSLTGKLSWTSPAAAALIILSALASIAAVQSGDQAHGPAERVPGARDAVQEHEETGERARNVLLVVAGLEVLGLLLTRQKVMRGVAALAGLAGGYYLYEAAEHGGDVVYSYAGGVGTRSGDSTDVRRLLVAGLYHQAQAERRAGRSEEAARLIEELLRQRPEDPTARFLAVESLIRDRKHPQVALDSLRAMSVSTDEPRLATRYGLLTAEAFDSAGHRDSARAVLSALAARFPESPAIRQALERLK